MRIIITIALMVMLAGCYQTPSAQLPSPPSPSMEPESSASPNAPPAGFPSKPLWV
jgi:uncharacterized lipoprotein YajG